jgi:hypothetical protein
MPAAIQNKDGSKNTSEPSIAITQAMHQLEELHPLIFRQAFGLTHEGAAGELGLEPQTMRAYSKKEPSRRVKKLAATLTKQWLDSGRLVVDEQVLLNALHDWRTG